MTRIIISLCLISVCTYSANAWPAMDSITGKTIEVFWPEKPSQVAKDGNHEIQYRFKGETELRLGEVTRWLRECYGRYCPSKRTRTFELNTFSKARTNRWHLRERPIRSGSGQNQEGKGTLRPIDEKRRNFSTRW